MREILIERKLIAAVKAWRHLSQVGMSRLRWYARPYRAAA